MMILFLFLILKMQDASKSLKGTIQLCNIMDHDCQPC